MVITAICDEWEIKRVLLYQGSYIDIMYYEAFEILYLNPKDLKSFKSFLVGFSGKKVQVKGYITLKAIFGEHDRTKG